MLQDKFNQQIDLVATKHPYVINLYLSLPQETRSLGKLDQAGEGTFTTKRNSNQLFRKTNSLGLNYDLLTNQEIKFKWIVIDYLDKGNNIRKKLVTSRNFFLSHGQFYSFPGKGFEPQCFLSLEDFGINKAREFESHLGKQENLFQEVA